jgi:hypothetical protein
VLARVEALLPPPRPTRLDEVDRGALAQARRPRLPAGGRASARDRARRPRRDRRAEEGDRPEHAAVRRGLPANNVLLTGSRGTGKSSLVKAMLARYARKGCALIEVDKADLVDLPDIAEPIARGPSASSCSATT